MANSQSKNAGGLMSARGGKPNPFADPDLRNDLASPNESDYRDQKIG